MDLSGRNINGYELQSLLHHGRIADTYLAEKSGYSVKKFAFKVLRQDGGREDHNYIERFMREMRLLEGLENPHIMPVLEWGVSEDELPYIILPYLPHLRTLREMMAESPFSPLAALPVFQAMGDALAHVHEQGILHRNLNPDKIFWRAGEHGREIYLGDFGLSKQPGFDVDVTTSLQSLVNTNYVSPEIVKGQEPDHRADLYSLAVTAYEVLTGRLPFPPAKNPTQTAMAHVTQAPPPPASFNLAFPEALSDWLLRGLAKNPADRYQSASAMTEAYQLALNSLSIDQQNTVYAQ